MGKSKIYKEDLGMKKVFLLVLFLVLGFAVNVFATGTTAFTVLSNGGDSGTLADTDADGDTFLTYDAGPSTGIAANTVTSTVLQVYGLGALTGPADNSANSFNDLYFVYSATNTGNYSDFVTVSSSVLSGLTWGMQLLADDGLGGGTANNGVHEAGETTVISGLAVGKDGYKNFFLKVSVPVGATHYSTSTVKLTLKAQNGSGTEPGDGWGNVDMSTDIVSAICVDTLAPGTITNLSVTQSAQGGQLDLAWTAPGDDPTIGACSAYLIRYSTVEAVTEINWSTVTVYANNISPRSAGQTETASITGLVAGTTYWFAVKTLDEVPFTSSISLGTPFAAPCSGANMSLAKARDNAIPKPGDRITYTLTYSNSGTTAANNIVVKDRIPANCTYVTGSIILNTVGKTDAVDGDEANYSSSVVTVNVGTVNAGANGAVTFQVDVQ